MYLVKKNKIILVFCAFIIGIIANNEILAQNINFAYDASGNRILREIIIPAAPPKNNTTLDSSDFSDTLMETNIDSIEKTSQEIYFEYFENTTVKLFPNPTDGILKIEMEL